MTIDKLIISAAFVDGGGIYGSVLHYSLTVAMVGSAFLLFLYCWRKGRLDMDEEPALEMMRNEDTELEDRLNESK